MFVFFTGQAICKTIAVLINTSKGFVNYRHAGDIQLVRATLVDAGLPPENILMVQKEDFILDPRNTIRGRVCLTDTHSIPHVSASVHKISEQYILNLFYLNEQFLMNTTIDDTVIFYMCGHGRDGFFKVCDRYFIFRADLMKAMKHLARRVKRALVILDTCQASTLVDESGLADNITVITSSHGTEYSYSSLAVPVLGIFGVDDFVYRIYERQIDKKMSIKEYFEGLSGHGMKSTVKCWGDGKYLVGDLFS